MKKFYVLLIAAALLAACGDESSSSAPASDPSEESSSSIEMTNESSSSTTVKNSSSSVGGDKSSSSVKKDNSSSSAVKSSSSVSPKSSSSEEVKQSSSSVVVSSSSVDIVKSSSSGIVFDTARFCTPGYSYCDRSLGADSVQAGAYKKFTDTRNGRTYYYLTINGVDKNDKPASVTVFAENLNIGVMVDGDKDQTNDMEIERYCYDNDTTNCDKYGGLYQWAEMMKLSSECNTKSCANLIKPNHQGICPDGWRLLTEDDFYIVMHANENDAGAKGVRATSFGGLNYSGYSLLGAGTHITPVNGGGFKNLNETSIWFYPVEDDYEDYKCALDGVVAKSSSMDDTNVSYKQNGHSVRCVKAE